MTPEKRLMPKFDMNKGLEFGLYTLGEHMPHPVTGAHLTSKERIKQIINMAQWAEEAGFDSFQVGESHQEYFISQAHFAILAAIGQATDKLKIGSSATIVSTDDPVRIFEAAATIDLIADGRFELVGGRASRLGLFKLLGYNRRDYEALFEEKFELLLQMNNEQRVTWEGNFRAPLDDMLILPRTEHENGGVPIWRAVGGSMQSAMRCGEMGVPFQLAHLTGPAETFQMYIDRFRKSAEEAGYDASQIPVCTGGFLCVRENTLDAYRTCYEPIAAGLKKANGTTLSKRVFAQGQDQRSIINVGDPELIIDKLLYQHELFNNQRYIGQIDFGGLSEKDIRQTIDMTAEKVIPTVKKYTRKDEQYGG